MSISLAEKLLAMGREVKDDLLTQYVLLREARDLAAAAGASETSLKAIEELGEKFDIDSFDMKMEALEKIARLVRDANTAGVVARAYFVLVVEAVKADKYDHATTALNKASSAAKVAKDAFLSSRAQELRDDLQLLKRDYELVKAALEKPGAVKSEAVGRYLCFVKDDWATGLPMLASEAKEPIKSLALRDLAKPVDPAEQAAVAGGWWDLAQKERSPWRKARLIARAGDWYNRAKEQAKGILALEIEKALKELRAAAASLTGEPGIASLKDGLVGHWRFDEGRGNATADWSGIGNTASLKGGISWAPGKVSGAVQLNGLRRQYVETSKAASQLGIGGASARTVAAWVYTQSFDNGGVFDLGNYASAENFALKTQKVENHWRVNLWSSGEIDFTHASLNSWVHFAVTYDGSVARVYANGSEVGSRAATLNTTDLVTFRIGRWRDDYFTGKIDEVRVYNRALTASEIRALADSP